MNRPDAFRFRRLDTIGTPDATQDQEFLAHCFVDTGLLDVLLDCGDPRRVIVGRTGSGKTALIQRLRERAQNVIVLAPESLALGYITNSNILQFVISLGVKLDVFFRLLWRHVLIVELLRKHSTLDSSASTRSLLDTLRDRFNSRRRHSLQRALSYMERFGNEFWQETDYRIKEVTSKFENELKASLGSAGPAVEANIAAGRTMTTEQRQEVIHRAQNVVNTIQLRELAEMMELVNEIFDDPQRHFYIVIDRLDEDWVEDKLRYALIRALLETVRDFHKVRNAKVIVALRLDLLDRVFSRTRDAGFQEEKYEGELVRVQWTRQELTELLDKRIDHLVKRSYTKGDVTHQDVLPRKIGGQPTIDYLLERTLMRPRDIIQFFNTCIQLSDGKPHVSVTAVRAAEGEYSRSRLRALADEWQTDYPNLLLLTLGLLRHRTPTFPITEITDDQIEQFCLNAAVNFEQHDAISAGTIAVAEGRMTAIDYRIEMIETLHRVGLIGLKIDSEQPRIYSTDGRRVISTAELTPTAKVFVHPSFWRVLGITERRSDAMAETEQPV